MSEVGESYGWKLGLRMFEHRRRKRWRVLRSQEQRGLCYYCGQRMEQRGGETLDHKDPLSNGGLDAWENTVAACLRCNMAKRARGPDWRPKGATT